MFGLLNLNKPAGMTSRAAIDQIKRLVRPAKIGHAGTLDPLAHGVLVVTIGPATRLTQRVQSWPKSYRGTFLLGRSSDTEDIEGTVVELDNPHQPTRDELQAALPALTGEIQQTPPAYSALKVKGKRAYELARQGEQVELKARPIMVHSLEIVAYQYPQLVLDIECGSGTYIRSLGRDLAQATGTAAVMSDLERTSIGPFRVTDSVDLAEVSDETLSGFLAAPRLAVHDLPQWKVNDDQYHLLGYGRELHCPGLDADEAAAITASGELAALLTRQSNGLYRPRCNFVHR